MTYLTLVWKNVTRNPRRTGLTVLSVAASLALLTLLLTVEDAMRTAMGRSATSLRVSVRHKTGFALLLPYAYRSKLEAVPGVAAVNAFFWYGGVYRNPRELMPSISCEPQHLMAVWGDRLKVPDDQLEAWKADRMGAMVAPLVAARYGWRVGDRIALKGTVWPVDLEFNVRGILTETFDPMIFLLHREYLEAAIGEPGKVGNYWLRVRTAADVQPVIRRIEEMFANAPHPVVAETEKGLFELMLGMMQMFRLVLMAIGSAVVASIMLVSANTIAMSVRERMSEVGVLRAMGFRRRHIFGFLLGESILMSTLGGVTGSALAWLACRHSATYVSNTTVAAFLSTSQPVLILYAAAISACVGLAGGLVPALGAVRVPVTRALRQVV